MSNAAERGAKSKLKLDRLITSALVGVVFLLAGWVFGLHGCAS
jgi:hypothetical protein